MKAIFIKELKENVNWAVLMLVGLSIALSAAVLDSEHRTFVNETMFLATLGGFSAVGVALGLLQIFQDQWKGRSAFVMHRPVSPSTIFWAKVLAGLTLYFPTTLIPFLAAAFWASTPGNMPAPFDWHMTLPGIWDLVNGVSWYFAGMFIASRPARWLGSRIMPLGWTLFLTAVGFSLESLGHAILITCISLLVLVPAVWGSFVYSVAPNRQPRILKFCQILVVTVGIFVALLAACGFANEEIQTAFRPSKSGEYSWYVIDKTGKPLRVDYIRNGEVRNLVALDGQAAGSIPPGRNWAQELRMAFIQLPPERRDEDDRSRFGFHYRNRYASEMYGLAAENWFYLVTQRVLVGYYANSHRLIGQIGADGFVAAPGSARPFVSQLRIGEYWSGGPFYDRTHVYTLNLSSRQLRTTFTTTADDPVLYLNSFGAGSDEETENGLRGSSAREEYAAISTESKIHLFRDGTEMFSFVRPVSRPAYSGLYMGRVINGPFILRSYSWGEGARPMRVMEMNDQGAIVKQIELPALAADHLDDSWWEVALIGVAMAPVVSAGQLVIRLWNGLSDNMRPGVLPVSTMAAVVAALLSVLYARRSALTARAKALWGVFVLLFGTPGLLGMMSMRDKPARVQCASCGKLRIVTRQHCEHCNTAFPPPEPQGIEVFE